MTTEKIEQYPKGTERLWKATYRADKDVGLMDGCTVKLSGTMAEAAAEAQRIAEEENMILQCLSRRY